jgi:hypothetical protein
MPVNWPKARTLQIDREGRWIIKRGRKQPPPARRRRRLALAVEQRLIEYSVADPPVQIAAELVGIHRISAILFYRELREIIFTRT